MHEIFEQMKKAFNLDAIVTLDYETFYKSKTDKEGKSYSLARSTYWQYINDPRFAITQFAYAEDDGEVFVLHPCEVEEFMASIQDRRATGERIGLVCQNTQFDGCISRWKFGVEWDFYIDTMLLSKQQQTGQSSSLKNQCLRFWPDDESMHKGTELVGADGVADYVEAGIFDTIAGYNAQDVRLTRALVCEYWKSSRTPMLEWFVMHYTLRGCIEPQFEINKALLHETIEEGIAHREKVIADAIAFLDSMGIPDATSMTFSSDKQYQELLHRMGHKVPKKLDKKTFTYKPALGKTDPSYIKFQQANPDLKPIFAARQIAKSNIAVTRAETMIKAAEAIGLNDTIGFYLNYNAAHTGRFSGGEKLNQQNLQRGSNHRLATMGLPGHDIVVVDLSNIELRVNLWFCEEDDLQHDNALGDLYCTMASKIYGQEVPPKKLWDNEMKHIYGDMRQVGKCCELGMQYGMSAPTFQAYMSGGPLGMEPIFFDDAFCQQVKNAYVELHPRVKQMWGIFGRFVLPALCGTAHEVRVGRNDCVIARKGELVLPSGRILCYKDMKCELLETAQGYQESYSYDDGTRDRFNNVVPSYTYGAKVFQNVIQAIARDVIVHHQHLSEQALHEAGIGWVSGSVHDELLCNVLSDHAKEGYDIVHDIMTVPPEWCSEIPLDCEGGYDKVYSK